MGLIHVLLAALIALMRHAACVRGNDTDTRQLYQVAIRACLLVMLDLARVESVRHVGRCLATRPKRRSAQRVCTALVLSPVVSRPALPRETRGPGRACPPLGHCPAVPAHPHAWLFQARHLRQCRTRTSLAPPKQNNCYLMSGFGAFLVPTRSYASLGPRRQILLQSAPAPRHASPGGPVAAAPLVGQRASVQRAPRAPHAPALHQVGRRAAPQVFVRRGARWGGGGGA